MKLEEILEKKLPVHINQSAESNVESILVSKISKDEFLKLFRYGDMFGLIDYPEIEDELDLSGAQKYCLVDSEGSPTLSLSKAVQTTPNLEIPYVELNISSDTGLPVAIILTYKYKDKLLVYIPRKGNTLRLDTNKTIEESGLFGFNWEDKNILEKSDLLYIVKDINRPALSKYLLRDIYNAFQECQKSTNIVEIDREACIQEFESKIKIICE